jgi:hypothetical protein
VGAVRNVEIDAVGESGVSMDLAGIGYDLLKNRCGAFWSSPSSTLKSALCLAPTVDTRLLKPFDQHFQGRVTLEYRVDDAPLGRFHSPCHPKFLGR